MEPRKDLFDFGGGGADLQGYDACFFCLVVSSAGMSEADYTRVTYDLTLGWGAGARPHQPGDDVRLRLGSGHRRQGYVGAGEEAHRGMRCSSDRAPRNARRGLENPVDADRLRSPWTPLAPDPGDCAQSGDHYRGVGPRDDSRAARASPGECWRQATCERSERRSDRTCSSITRSRGQHGVGVESLSHLARRSVEDRERIAEREGKLPRLFRLRGSSKRRSVVTRELGECPG